ncbi:hypothetical protein LTR62_004719 [Meristemomyces frigidus]|uniref:Uncharacterized protein n=1 Tax=Meristemomyces frigidus TaxID=1508187 RepID=A0AAN7YNZ7_9PEZI|nr:hypothetical protein LTR62_004719 [Meristemomyces frigidus]
MPATPDSLDPDRFNDDDLPGWGEVEEYSSGVRCRSYNAKYEISKVSKRQHAKSQKRREIRVRAERLSKTDVMNERYSRNKGSDADICLRNDGQKVRTQLVLTEEPVLEGRRSLEDSTTKTAQRVAKRARARHGKADESLSDWETDFTSFLATCSTGWKAPVQPYGLSLSTFTARRNDEGPAVILTPPCTLALPVAVTETTPITQSGRSSITAAQDSQSPEEAIVDAKPVPGNNEHPPAGETQRIPSHSPGSEAESASTAPYGTLTPSRENLPPDRRTFTGPTSVPLASMQRALALHTNFSAPLPVELRT